MRTLVALLFMVAFALHVVVVAYFMVCMLVLGVGPRRGPVFSPSRAGVLSVSFYIDVHILYFLDWTRIYESRLICIRVMVKISMSNLSFVEIFSITLMQLSLLSQIRVQSR